MRKEFDEQIQLGGRVLGYTREAKGVVAVSLFHPRTCRAIIAAVREHEGWATAKVSRRGEDGEFRSVVDHSHRTANVLYSQHLGAVGRKFDEKMNRVLKPLVNHLWQRNLTEHEGTQLVHYTAGGHYIVHSDIGQRTRNRHFSVVCYLNDDFEGGGTRFPALNYCTTPQSGTAILFPSGFPHGGEPVTSGEKFVLVSWITGPVPEP